MFYSVKSLFITGLFGIAVLSKLKPPFGEIHRMEEYDIKKYIYYLVNSAFKT